MMGSFNPFSALTSKIYGGMALLALALAGVQTLRIEGFLFIHGYKQDLADRDAEIAAGKVNLAALKADKARVETTRAAITKDTDHETPLARTGALAAARAYADTHRCLRTPEVAAAGQAGGSVPEPAAAPGSSPSSSAPVAVDAATLDACSLNSSDLQQAYEWAQKVWGH